MKRTIYSIAIVLAMSVFAADVNAQGGRGCQGGRGGGGSPEQFIERMFEGDANSDGKLSADELGDRGARMLERADENGDGFLTKEELTTMMESRGGRGGRGGGPGGGPGGRGGGPDMGQLLSMTPFMKALDKDGDGKLSSAEIKNATKALATLDKDKDGTLTVEELMPDPAEMFGGRGGRGGRGGGGRGGAGGRGGGRGGAGDAGGRPERDNS